MSTPALVIVKNGIAELTYRGSIALQIQAVGRVSVSRYGLAEGDVTWKAPTSLISNLAPAFGSVHPIFSWLNLENISFDYDKAYSLMTGHYAGAFPGAISVFDYQPSFGEEPIQTHPNFGGPASVVDDGSIVGASGGPILNSAVTPTGNNGVVFNPDGSFKSILSGSPNNMGGVTSYLLGQGFYVESSVSSIVPDCSNDGTIQTPDSPPGGSPPSLPSGGNWLQAPTVFTQRALVYDIRRSWKASGRKGWNPIVYA
jgi:hypothetical protein